METPRRAAIGVALVAGVVLAAVGLGLPTAVFAQETNGTAADEVSFGTQVASFMQATAAEANSTVEQGMWQAAIDESSEPDATIAARAERLRNRLDRLETRSAALSGDGDGPASAGLVYTARASAVRVELASLRRSINETAAAARRHGVDDGRLADLRDRVENVSGPEIAAAARNVTDAGPPEWVPGRGPDREPGPPTDRPGADRGNGTEGDRGDGGPPDGPGDRGPPGDSGDGGPPDDSGDGGPPADPSDGGPPNDPGDGGPPNDSGDGGDGGPGSDGGPGGGGGPGGRPG